MKLCKINCYQSSRKMEYLFLQHFDFLNDSLEIVLFSFNLFLSTAGLCLCGVQQFAKAELLPLIFTGNICDPSSAVHS